MAKKKKKLKECPNCKEKWSSAEIEAQECGTCNYPRCSKVSYEDSGVEDKLEFDDNL